MTVSGAGLTSIDSANNDIVGRSLNPLSVVFEAKTADDPRLKPRAASIHRLPKRLLLNCEMPLQA